MDTEEHLEIQEARRIGTPQTDEGPYYHPAWWESYKGSVKGKLGGAIIGGLLGAAVGVAAAVFVPLAGGVLLTTSALAMTVSGFSAAGMLYGAHEFADTGRVAGGIAAGLETAEKRNDVKFSQLEKKIDKLQATLTGEELPAEPQADDKNAQSLSAQEALEYKTTHCDEHCMPTEKPRLVFWNVAIAGLLVGLAAGALLASGGLAAHVLVGLGAAAETGALSTVGTYAASMLTMGLFGASFGINRDLFRQVFDRTDLLFRGIFTKSKSPEPTVVMPARMPESHAQSIEKQMESGKETVDTVVYEAQTQYPKSETYHRDKVIASAKQALLGLDHTKSIPH